MSSCFFRLGTIISTGISDGLSSRVFICAIKYSIDVAVCSSSGVIRITRSVSGLIKSDSIILTQLHRLLLSM